MIAIDEPGQASPRERFRFHPAAELTCSGFANRRARMRRGLVEFRAVIPDILSRANAQGKTGASTKGNGARQVWDQMGGRAAGLARQLRGVARTTSRS